MTRVLPPVLSTTELPLAELCAARIDGEVFPIGDCFAPVDAVDASALRGAALLSLGGHRAIAVLESALWVHGLCLHPPDVHRLWVSRRERIRLPNSRRLAAGSAQFGADDLLRLGGMQVTTIERTVIDLLFADVFDQRRADLVGAAFAAQPSCAARCAARIAGAEHLPGKRRALRRLAELPTARAATQPALTRYTS
jgi:hypothetical protein